MARMLKTASMATLLAAVLSSVAYASIVGTSGDVVQIAPPPSVEFDQLQSDTEAFAFDEQQDVTLAADLPVDITVPGTYDEPGDLTPGVLAAGTVVDSHFIHSDNVVFGSRREFDGSVAVDGDILGISVLTRSLDAGDPLVGAPGTAYPTGKTFRRLALAPTEDILVFEADGRTVTVHLETTWHVDQVRILTQGELPGGSGEGCTPGYWKQPQHFDSWTPPYDPTDQFSEHFEDAFPGLTLVDVLWQGGGGLNALGRHTVAALLNAASPDVDFAFTPQEVIDSFNAVYPGTKAEYEALKNEFAAENETSCPLN